MLALGRRLRTGAIKWLRGLAVALIWLVPATGVLFLVKPLLGRGDSGLLYLPVVALAAASGGIEAGAVAGTLAMVLGEYLFVRPYNTFSISQTDPREITSLIIFIVIGLLMGLQSGYSREQEAIARSHEREARLLDRLSARLSSQTGSAAIISTLLEEITVATGACMALIMVPSPEGDLQNLAVAGMERATPPVEQMAAARWAYNHASAIGLHASTPGAPTVPPPEIHLPLKLSDRVLGVLTVGSRQDNQPYTEREEGLIQSVSQLLAVLLERQRLQKHVADAQAQREAETLKVTLMSSVSHELKTPLAAITARVTNLLEEDTTCSADLVKQELGFVAEDLRRLNLSFSDLLDLSRFQSGGFKPRLDLHELGEILGTVMTHLPARYQERVRFDLPETLPPLRVDHSQVARALQHVLENGLQYSPAGEPVTVGAEPAGPDIRIWLEDHGPGVAPEERERIFEPFYRGRASSLSPAGSGLGLTIAHEIVSSHGGTMTVEDALPRGTRFVIILPGDSTAERTSS